MVVNKRRAVGDSIQLFIFLPEARHERLFSGPGLGYHKCFDAEGSLNLPSTTSELLELQGATNAELCVRLGEVFKRYRSVAFAGRNDNLFTEHWTPEVAAAGYDFDGFEIKGASIVLHGAEYACGFVYRISVAFPLDLIDNTAAIESYFQQLSAERSADSELSSATQTRSNPLAS